MTTPNSPTAQTLIAVVIAVCCAFVLSLFLPTTPAQATSTIDPDAINTLEIHRFEQPEQLGEAADGLPQDTTNLRPIPGTTFSATKVPGIDLTTADGQQQASQMAISEAASLVSEASEAARGVTNAEGRATLSGLEVGLYYVQEHDPPAGHIAAAPMLIALPLTNPQTRNSWLNTVHVYPKSATVDITLEITDQHAVTLGDEVAWLARSGIPPRTKLDFYRIDAIIGDHLSLMGRANLTNHVKVQLNCRNCSRLVAGSDFTLRYSAEARRLTLDFLAPGRQKLEDAAADDPTANVSLEYSTTVDAEGFHSNEARLYTNRDAADTGLAVSDTALTKWGPLSVRVHAADDPQRGIAGARFQLYLTLEDALAQRNPISIHGAQEWVSDEDGRLVINGLRFSNFVNGLDRERDDELFRYYYVVPVGAPDGWSWVDDTPTAGTVTSTSEDQTLIFQMERPEGVPDEPQDSEPDTTAPGDQPAEPVSQEELPMTGAQITGALILAAVLVAGGLMLLRRRREASATASVDE